jgi:hypothetical protein
MVSSWIFQMSYYLRPNEQGHHRYKGITFKSVFVYYCCSGANIINYGLFAVIYDAQLSRDKIFTIYGIIHRSI